MKRQPPTLDQLRHVAPFSACSDRDLAFISRRITEHRSVAGDVLASEGNSGRQFFTIVDGHASVLIGDRPIARLQAGDFFGEVALLDWGTRTATVVADTDLVTLVCGAQEFDEIVAFAPIIARKLLVGLSRRLRAADLALSAAADAAGGYTSP